MGEKCSVTDSIASNSSTLDLGQRSVAPPVEGQQGAVAKGTDEREVVRPCLGVAFSNPPDIAIVAAGGTECQPSR